MARLAARFQLKWSIVTVLTVSMVLTIVLLMGLTTALDIRRERAMFRTSLEEKSLILLSATNQLVADSSDTLDRYTLDTLASFVDRQQGISHFELLSSDGMLLASLKGKPPAPGLAANDALIRAFQGREPVSRLAEDTLEIISPLEADGQVIGFVRFGLDKAPLGRAIGQIAIQSLVQGAILLVIGGSLALFTARRFARPVKNLAQAARDVGEGNFHASLTAEERRSDEIGDLARAFLTMTKALEESRQQLEKSVQDERRKAVHLQALKEMAELGLEHRSRDELLHGLLEGIVRAHDADSGSILLYDEREDTLKPVALVGLNEDDFKLRTFQPGEGVAGKVFQERKSEVIQDVASSTIIANPRLKERGVKTIVAAPLKVVENLTGVVFLHYLSPRDIDDTQLSVIELMAEKIAQVVEKQRLLDLERQYVAELAIVNNENLAMMRELEDAQDRNIQSAKMAAVGQLAGGVAHEINNPLASILGFAQLGKQKFSVLNDKPIESNDISYLGRYLGYIEVEAKRTAQIVSRLLSFTFSPEQEMVSVDVKQLLEQAARMNTNELVMPGIKCELQLEEDLPHIDGHPTSLAQAFNSVITNAITAMPQGGTLKVTSRYIEPGSIAPSGMVEMKFEDTGFGIPEENVPKVFEPFFTTAEPGKGTGLGMYVCYQVVRQHEGETEISSREGEGTVVTIRFPVSRHEEGAADE